MSGFYTLAYAIGFPPWEQAGRQAAEEFSSLLDRETSQRPGPPGRAVDLGCGTGAHTIKLANRGWQTVGVDNQRRALRIARARPAASRADVTFIHGDVTTLQRDDIGGAADFFLDVGCFHHRPGPARQAWPPPSPQPPPRPPHSCCSPSAPPGADRWRAEPAGNRSRQPSPHGRSSPTSPPTPPACHARCETPRPAGTASSSGEQRAPDDRRQFLIGSPKLPGKQHNAPCEPDEVSALSGVEAVSSR